MKERLIFLELFSHNYNIIMYDDVCVKISNITILNVQICEYETIENKSMVKNIDELL